MEPVSRKKSHWITNDIDKIRHMSAVGASTYSAPGEVLCQL